MSKNFSSISLFTNSVVKFYNTADTHFVSLKSPAAQGADFDLVLPGSDTASGAVVSNGSGVLSISLLANANIAAAAAIAVNKLAALTASRAVVSDGSGFISAATTTSTEIGYVNGVTSAIQTQLNGKASTLLDNLTVASLASQSLLVGSSSSQVINLPVGSVGQILTVTAGPTVAWANNGSASTATPTAQGIVTSYDPIVASALLDSSSTTINITTSDGYRTILASSTSAVTINLPAAASNAGRRLLIKKTGTGTNAVTIDPNSSELIEGGATTFLTMQYAWIQIDCNGTGWYVTAQGGDQIVAAVQRTAAQTGQGTNAANLTSISVPTGTWKIFGVFGVAGSGTSTVNDMRARITTSSGTIESTTDDRINGGEFFDETTATNFNESNGQKEHHMVIPYVTFSLTSTSTVYLVCKVNYTGGDTYDRFGRIVAERL